MKNPIHLSEFVTGASSLYDVFLHLSKQKLFEIGIDKKYTFHLLECKTFKLEACFENEHLLYIMVESGAFQTDCQSMFVDDIFNGKKLSCFPVVSNNFTGNIANSWVRLYYEEGELFSIYDEAFHKKLMNRFS